MKRTLLVLLLILCLLLCSCAPAISGAPESTPPSEEPTATPTQPTEPQPTDPPATEPPSFPMGATGEQTDGALRCLPLDIGVRCEAYLWGDAMLFFNAYKIQLRSLQDGSLLADAPGIGATTATIAEDYIIYYLPSTHQIVFRDKNLDVKTVGVSVSSDVAEMLFSQDGSKAFYHIYPSNTIVELDIQTGEKRVIPVDGPQIWLLSDLHFEDSILRYWSKEDGSGCYGFVDLETGAYLGEVVRPQIQSWDDGYYLRRENNGRVEHLIVTEGTERYIEVRDHEDLHYNIWALPQVNSLFALHSGYESSAAILELYDLTTGACTASLTVDLGQPYQQVANVFADPSGEYIWLCLKVGNTSDYQMVLYRWDFHANAVTE